MEGAGGSGEAQVPTVEDCLARAQAQLMQMHDTENQLCAELENTKKGNGINQGRLPCPGP